MPQPFVRCAYLTLDKEEDRGFEVFTILYVVVAMYLPIFRVSSYIEMLVWEF